jgi:hypothetical protein
MLTIFSTAKPFQGHSAVIQRNALRSWTLLHPDAEVILFGDEEGAAEVCSELGIRHEPQVQRNEMGLKRVDYYFDRAQEIARHDILCYVNCDIVLTQDFVRAIQQVRTGHSKFLVVGRRWDTDIRNAIDFSTPTWCEEVWRLALAESRQCDEKWIDYFAFSKGLYYKKVLPFVIGRPSWDNWLVWCAENLGAAVVDASAVVRAVHQSHDYAYHPKGKEGVWNDEQAERNFSLAGGWKHLWFIEDAAWRLQRDGSIKRNGGRRKRRWLRWRNSIERTLVYSVWMPSWHFVLDVTRPLRTVLGLRSKKAR